VGCGEKAEEIAMMDWSGNTGWWSFGMMFMGLFWIALIAVAVWAVLRLTRGPDGPASSGVESPRQILDRRFAAGEIDAQTYAESRRVLEGRSVDNPPR
jgi:putative membrane protein